MDRAHCQLTYRIRFDWGLPGANAIGEDADIVAVIDVLSFTTTLSVALDADVTLLPYRCNDDTAQAYAAEHDAVLAVGRSEAGAGDITLSPGTIRAAGPLTRLVLPSPNGSAILSHLGASSAHVLAPSLRNAAAAARWIVAHHQPEHTTVAVIAAGERWPEESLRPAVEDMWGAGALLDRLLDAGWSDMSPEALVAHAAYRAISPNVRTALHACASGRELIDKGYQADVDIAAETDSSSIVPLLRDQQFVPER